MSSALEIQLIAILVSVACALPGVFLVLRGLAMMSDAITHTVLLGIVLAFFWTGDLSSPLLMVGAALMGCLTVWLIQQVEGLHLVRQDAAIGIVFPLLFSIAIILITRYAGSVHLDTDSVLLGELAFAPFDRLVLFGVDLGCRPLYTAGGMLLINLVVITLLFKELKLTTFDPLLAVTLGISPAILHHCLMLMVSLTAVTAFDSVGSVLVIAFMIAPANAAYLLTHRLHTMLILSGIFGGISAVVGFQVAYALDVSIPGSMATTTGVLFALVLVFAPKRGLIALWRTRHRQKNIL